MSIIGNKGKRFGLLYLLVHEGGNSFPNVFIDSVESYRRLIRSHIHGVLEVVRNWRSKR